MNWRTQKMQSYEQARTILIKVGSAVLTNASGIDVEIIEGLARQISVLCAQGKRVVLVSSGAVAAGRSALRTVPTGMAERQAAAAIGQSRLMHFYDEAFARFGIVSAQVLLTRDDLRSRQRFLNARNTFAALLDWGAIPIVNENDTVATQELKFGDNDCLASLLLNMVEAELFINLTSSAGVLSENPQLNPNAPIMPCIENIHALDLNLLCGGKTSVGTGGMYSKLLAASRAAQLGVPTLIIPGKILNILECALPAPSDTLPADVGTWVCPDAQHISRRKYWLAYQSDTQGDVCVDAGAAHALREKGSSLLAGGVCAVNGNFGSGALVRLCTGSENPDNPDMQVLGVGLTNYSAADLRRIMGKKRHEVAALLGDAHYPEVVHRDNMLLDAAV